MEVACEVQVNLLHGQHLGISATGSTALDAETRAERWLTQGYGGLLANPVKTQCQADADGGLANTGLRGTDGCHQNQTALPDLLLIDE